MYTSGLLSISFWVLMFGCFWGGGGDGWWVMGGMEGRYKGKQGMVWYGMVIDGWVISDIRGMWYFDVM